MSLQLIPNLLSFAPLLVVVSILAEAMDVEVGTQENEVITIKIIVPQEVSKSSATPTTGHKPLLPQAIWSSLVVIGPRFQTNQL
jgi:hypothetical protein